MLGTLKKCKIIQLLLRIFHILLETKDRENIFLLYWVYFPDYPYFIAGLLDRERSSRTHPIQLSVCRSSFYRMARIEVNSDLSGFTKGTVVATSGTRLRFWRPLKQPEGNPNTGMPETNDLEMTGLRFPHGPRSHRYHHVSSETHASVFSPPHSNTALEWHLKRMLISIRS